MLLSRIFSRVFSFEPNRYIFDKWRAHAPTNVDCIHAAVSSSNGFAELMIPVEKGVILSVGDRWKCLQSEGND